MRVGEWGTGPGDQRYWQVATLEAKFPGRSGPCSSERARFGMPERYGSSSLKPSLMSVRSSPRVIELGKQFFKLDQFQQRPCARGRCAPLSGRPMPEAEYDFSYCANAYNGIRQIPVHLASKEFFRSCP